MGLFSKLFGDDTPEVGFDLKFDEKELRESIWKLSKPLYDYRNDDSSKVIIKFIRRCLNLKIIELAQEKELEVDAYAYHRGQIDALRHILNVREKFILDQENAKKTKKDKNSADHESKRKYMGASHRQAGLSI